MKTLQFRVLYREFLFRVVDLELLAPRGDITKLLGQFAAVLVVISMWIMFPAVALSSIPTSLETGMAVSWIGEHFVIATTMLVVGLFAVLSWDSLFPDRRDVLVLSPLPLRARTLFRAKVAAVATALSLTVVALNVFPGIAGPFFFASAPTVPPPTYDAAMASVEVAEMQSVLDRDLASARLPGKGWLVSGSPAGMVVGIVKHGERRVFAFGTAQPDSIYEIGSISKTFTGLLLAQMVAEGKVRLDDPVRSLLPPGIVDRPSGAEITLLDLTTHHSGLPGMPDNFHPMNPSTPYVDYHLPNMYSFVARRGLAKPPAPEFLYSNFGVALLGQAIANRAGVSYPNLVKSAITDKLHMPDTVVSLSKDQDERFIRAYGPDGQFVLPWDMDAFTPAGGIRSTAADMLTYLEAQLDPAKFASTDNTFARALTLSHQLHADAPQGMRVALNWLFNPKTGAYFHGGNTGGYSSYVFFHPQGGYAAVVLLNLTIGPSDLVGEHIEQRFAGTPAVALFNRIAAGRGNWRGVLRAFGAYWITMLLAGAFSLCCVISIQGLAQLLPRQRFLRISSFLQIAFFIVLVTVYFLQPPFSQLQDLAANQTLLMRLPSYWFFGLFQQLNGSLPSPLEVLAKRAWIGLAAAATGAVAAYLICYFRTLRKIAEQPDILPSTGGLRWLPAFGQPLETAVVHFSLRTLARSRQHRVILAFYIGIAFGLALFLAEVPVLEEQLAISHPWREANAPMLVSSIIILCSVVLGCRVVFAMPLELRANWIFRVTPIASGQRLLAARRRAMLLLSVAPVWIASAAVFLWLWPWRAALGHLAILALIGILLTEFSLRGVQKLPFTCSYQPGKSKMNVAILAYIGYVFLLQWGATYERTALAGRPAELAVIIAVLAAAVFFARQQAKAHAGSGEGKLQFEDLPDPALFELGLHRDGVLAMEPEKAVSNSR